MNPISRQTTPRLASASPFHNNRSTMHPKIVRAALLFFCSLVFIASHVTTAHAGEPKPKPTPGHEESEPSKVRPHRGMSKAQVRKLYGNADNQQVTSRGETWFYFFNSGHYWIPYYFGKARTGTFHFSEAGVLTDFEYNQED